MAVVQLALYAATVTRSVLLCQTLLQLSQLLHFQFSLEKMLTLRMVSIGHCVEL